MKKTFVLNEKQYEYYVTQLQKNKNTGTTKTMRLLINNRMYTVTIDLVTNKIFVHNKQHLIQHAQRTSQLQKNISQSSKQALSSAFGSNNEIKSPLAGRVVRVLCSVGDPVKRGQPLIVVESMKMENEICAHGDGVIKTLFIALDNLVQPNQSLVELEMKGGRDGKHENADDKATI